MITIQLNGLNNLSRAVRRIQAAGDVAGMRAMRKVGTAVRAKWSRQVREELNLPMAVIKLATRVFHNRSVLTITVDSTGAPVLGTANRRRALNVINFNGRQTKRGVKAKIKRKTIHIERAFIATIRGNTVPGVYIRIGKPRFPIRGIYTTAMEDVAKDKLPQVTAFAQDKLIEAIDRQLAYELRNILD